MTKRGFLTTIAAVLLLGCSRGTSVPTEFSYPNSPMPREYPPIIVKGIRGRVVRERSRVPLGKVLVERMDESFSERFDARFTGADGRFDFGSVRPGTHYLRFSLDGYDDVMIRVTVRASGKPDFEIELPLAG